MVAVRRLATEKVETLEKLRWRRCNYCTHTILADGEAAPPFTPAPAKEAEAGPSGEKGGPPKKKAKK